MQTNNNQSAGAQALQGAAGKYEVTAATAKLLDCLRAGNDYYGMIADALQMRYADILTPDDIEQKAQPYLTAITGICDMLHAELSSGIVDALSDTRNTAADAIRL